MAATSETERSILAAAGQALLARSEDFAPGSLMGFLFTETGQFAMALVMLRSGIFSRLTAWAGIVGFGLLLAFTLWATFTPAFYQVAAAGRRRPLEHALEPTAGTEAPSAGTRGIAWAAPRARSAT